MTQEIYTDLEVTPEVPKKSFGQELVGINFNPSGDYKVNRVKELCAELADILFEHEKTVEQSHLRKLLVPSAYAQILNAQMNVVKVLTLK